MLHIPMQQMQQMLLDRYTATIQIIKDLYEDKTGPSDLESKAFLVRLSRETWFASHRGSGRENRLYAIWSTILSRLAKIVSDHEKITLSVCPQQKYGLNTDLGLHYPDSQQSPDFGLTITYAESATQLHEEFFGIVEIKPCVDALPNKDLLSDEAKAYAARQTMQPYYHGQLTDQVRAIFHDYPHLRACHVISAAGLWARGFAFARKNPALCNGAYADYEPTVPSFTDLFCILNMDPSAMDLSIELRTVIKIMADGWLEQSSSKATFNNLHLDSFEPGGVPVRLNWSKPVKWVAEEEEPAQGSLASADRMPSTAPPLKKRKFAQNDYGGKAVRRPNPKAPITCTMCRTTLSCTQCRTDYAQCTLCGHPAHPINDCPDAPNNKSAETPREGEDAKAGNDKGAVEVNDEGEADEHNEQDGSD